MKVIKYITVAIAVAGFLLILGTAGSSDLGLISIESATNRFLIGLGMLVGGLMSANFIVEKENA